MRVSETINLLPLNVLSAQMLTEDMFLVIIAPELEHQKSYIMTIYLETLQSLPGLEIKVEAIEVSNLRQ